MLPFEKKKRDILTRVRAKSDKKFGFDPDNRPIDEHINYGIVNLDKPRGPTSHQVSAYAKDILGVPKCGHSGTLDPAVTGVLPVAAGSATRIVQLLLTAGKEYVGVMRLHQEVTDENLEKVREQFVGKITQLPPLKSSVKRAHRQRTIYELEFLEREGKNVLFRVSCQAGTYIRKLMHDMGTYLGGAHMAELRRTQAGPFKEDSTVTLQDLKDAVHYLKEEGREDAIRKCVVPMERAVEHLPKIWVQDSSVESLCHGANLHVPGIAKVHSGINKGDIVAVMSLKNELVCYGQAACDTKKLLGTKGVAVIVEKVFMRPGTYPRMTTKEA